MTFHNGEQKSWGEKIFGILSSQKSIGPQRRSGWYEVRWRAITYLGWANNSSYKSSRNNNNINTTQVQGSCDHCHDNQRWIAFVRFWLGWSTCILEKASRLIWNTQCSLKFIFDQQIVVHKNGKRIFYL